jgi:hypothetical protein
MFLGVTPAVRIVRYGFPRSPDYNIWQAYLYVSFLLVLKPPFLKFYNTEYFTVKMFLS